MPHVVAAAASICCARDASVFAACKSPDFALPIQFPDLGKDLLYCCKGGGQMMSTSVLAAWLTLAPQSDTRSSLAKVTNTIPTPDI